MTYSGSTMTDRNVVHTYPVNDLVEHDTGGDTCICGPTTEAVFRDDGSNGWHVIHHSLDGREHHEPDHNPDHCRGCTRG